MTNKNIQLLNTLFLSKKGIMFFTLFLFSISTFCQKKYFKSYFSNGNLKEEGWLKNNEKINFWKFYYKNGTLKKEGHYKNNLPTKYWYFYRRNSSKEKEGHFVNGKQNNWWLYYDNSGYINHKCQLKNNKKNGYCLLYKKKKLIKAVKFKNGKKINEWTDFSSFKKENSLKDLR